MEHHDGADVDMPEASHFASDNPIVQKLLAGTAPPPIKLAAAKGALPITPIELFYVLGALRDDEAAEVRSAVEETATSMADGTLAGLLGNPTLPPQLVEYFSRHALDKPRAMEAVVGNRAATDATLEFIARGGSELVLELLVTNQVRLIRAPRLIDAALENPLASPDQRRRLLEVREEFFLKKEREEQRKRDEEERLARLREKKEWTVAELEKLQEDLARETERERESGTLFIDPDEPAASETDEEYKSATARIMAMGVPEKIMLAIRGNRTERLLLVRDSNRLVASSVAKSPKLTEAEIEFIAGMRNVIDEVIRIVANRREAQRNYNVVLILIKNPRTPLPIALNLLPRLQARDLKSLQGDKNVAETLRRQAKQRLDKANQPGGSKH